MSWIVGNIEWVLVVAGLGTCSMLYQALAPRAAWRTVFGEEAQGAVAEFMARSWGVMIFSAGILLIYAAWHPETRFPILLYAIVGKLSFTLQVFATPRFHRRLAFVLALADLVIIALLGWYLLVVM
jgi:hypothetical protein